MSDAPIYRARQALKEVFGFDAFRPFQEKVFSAVFAGRDAFVVAPTGGGISLSSPR